MVVVVRPADNVKADPPAATAQWRLPEPALFLTWRSCCWRGAERKYWPPLRYIDPN